ncbi:hypothetical protein HZS_113, partial [Henneguya salminicola]
MLIVLIFISKYIIFCNTAQKCVNFDDLKDADYYHHPSEGESSEFCPNLFYNEADSLQLCCSTENMENIENQLTLVFIEEFSCNICSQNIRRIICDVYCHPNHRSYMNFNKNDIGEITDVKIIFPKLWLHELVDSCKNRLYFTLQDDFLGTIMLDRTHANLSLEEHFVQNVLKPFLPYSNIEFIVQEDKNDQNIYYEEKISECYADVDINGEEIDKCSCKDCQAIYSIFKNITKFSIEHDHFLNKKITYEDVCGRMNSDEHCLSLSVFNYIKGFENGNIKDTMNYLNEIIACTRFYLMLDLLNDDSKNIDTDDDKEEELLRCQSKNSPLTKPHLIFGKDYKDNILKTNTLLLIFVIKDNYNRSSEQYVESMAWEKKLCEYLGSIDHPNFKVSYFSESLIDELSEVMKNDNYYIYLSIFIVLVLLSIYPSALMCVGMEDVVSILPENKLTKSLKDVYTNIYYGPPLYFIIDSKFEYGRKESFKKICSLAGCNNDSIISKLIHESRNSENSSLQGLPISWVDSYIQWLLTEDFECCYVAISLKNGDPLPNPNEYIPCASSNDENYMCESCILDVDDLFKNEGSLYVFKKHLHHFAKSPANAQCPYGGSSLSMEFFNLKNIPETEDINHIDDNIIVSSGIKMYHTPMISSQQYISAMKNAKDIAQNLSKKLNHRTFAYSRFYIDFEVYETL